MDKAKRKAIIAGNWKMNKTASEAAVLVDELIPRQEGRHPRGGHLHPVYRSGHRCG